MKSKKTTTRAKATSRPKFAKTLRTKAAPPPKRATSKRPRTSRKAGELIQDQRKKRLTIYRKNFGAPRTHYRGEDLGAFAIDILAFPKAVGAERGHVLITNGMSDHRPPRPDPNEAYPQTELIWYTRDVTEEKAKFLYWLSAQAFETGKPIEFGEFVQAPKPPLAGCKSRGITFLRPITTSEKGMHTDLALLTGYFELFAIHLLSDKEFRQAKKSDEGFNELIDLFDKNKYPLFFDPQRPSYV